MKKGKKQSFNDIDCFFFVYLLCFCQLCFVYQLCFCLLCFICLISDTLDLRRADNIALFALMY